jgi:hypothetical protein
MDTEDLGNSGILNFLFTPASYRNAPDHKTGREIIGVVVPNLRLGSRLYP